MAKLGAYDGQTFYGSPAGGEAPVPGLRKELRHGRQGPHPYSYLVFLDEAGIKWKIIPVLNAKGRVGSLKLLHRNRQGRRGLHSQGRSEWGTTQGLADLLKYIRQHEIDIGT